MTTSNAERGRVLESLSIRNLRVKPREHPLITSRGGAIAHWIQSYICQNCALNKRILTHPNIQLTELYLCLLLVHRDAQLEEGLGVIGSGRNLKVPLIKKKTCTADID